MPQIIVAADRGAAFGDGTVTFRERVNVADFESEHFATQLVERLGWAVEDADQAERAPTGSHAIAEQSESEIPQGPETRQEPQSPTEPQLTEPPDRNLDDERVSVPSPA